MRLEYSIRRWGRKEKRRLPVVASNEAKSRQLSAISGQLSALSSQLSALSFQQSTVLQGNEEGEIRSLSNLLLPDSRVPLFSQLADG